MAGSIVITEAELLDALAQAAPGDGPEDARTVQEIIRQTGLGERRVRGALRTLHAAGRLAVHRVRRIDVSGNVQRPPAYTILPA